MKTKILKKAIEFAKKHAMSSLTNWIYNKNEDCLISNPDGGCFEDYSNWDDFFAESLNNGLEIIGFTKEEIKYFFDNDIEEEVLTIMCEMANSIFKDYLNNYRLA